MTQNADIQTFEQHGDQFWDLNGPYRTLHEINPTRVKLIQQYIQLSGQNILDIGCGGGILSESLAQQGAVVTGIDLSLNVLNAAKAHAVESGLSIQYQHGDTSSLAELGQQFDHITCMEMLEHVPDPQPVLHDIAKLLKPGGYVFLSTLNRTRKAWLGAIVAAEYLFRFVPKGTHNHQWFITPSELTNMVEHCGLKAVAICGLDYHPLLKTAKLSRNVDINYFLIAQKPIS